MSSRRRLEYSSSAVHAGGIDARLARYLANLRQRMTVR